MNDIFSENILFPTDVMLSIKGCYATSKDEKVIVELKKINREKRIEVQIRGISDFTEAKKLSELLGVILINKNGFIRNSNELKIKKEDNGAISIELKD
jgi:2'-5' RNA ligase